jgi:hypothetical protein
MPRAVGNRAQGKIMGKCLKGESEAKKKNAKFACEKCGAKTAEKSQVCKPKKLKQDKAGKKK